MDSDAGVAVAAVSLSGFGVAVLGLAIDAAAQFTTPEHRAGAVGAGFAVFLVFGFAMWVMGL
jgi:hypothetical protein